MNDQAPSSRNAGDRLWELIPRWTRAKDQQAGGVLEGLVRALAVGVDAAQADVLRLLDDMFVETCAPELVPLIGDLVGESTDPRIPVARQRYQVKRAIHWRRRKGTPAQLEALAWIISGFRSRVVEPHAERVQGISTAQLVGLARPQLGTVMPKITGSSRPDAIRIVLDVVWPVREREVLLEPLSPGGPDLHAISPENDIGLRRSDGRPIFRGDDPASLVGPGLAIEVFGVGGDLEQLGTLKPRFLDLGGPHPPRVTHRTLAIDPERGRVAGPSAIVGSILGLRRYRLRFWEPLLAERVTATPHHLGDGVYTFAGPSGDAWLTDDQANKLIVYEGHRCSEGRRFGRGQRVLVTRLSSGHGCGFNDESPFIALPPDVAFESMEQALESGLELDTAGLRRFFSIEDEWGWDLFRNIRLVTRFSKDSPPDDTVEVDVRRGRFRIGPAMDSSSMRVHYYRPYDVDELRGRVREELLRGMPLGRRAIVEFRDTPIPGYFARNI